MKGVGQLIGFVLFVGLPIMWAKLMAWIQSLNFVTQSAHFFAGLGVVALGAHFMSVGTAAILFLGIWAAPKEIVFDSLPFGEGHGSPDWEDLFFYVLGTCVTYVCVALAQ